MRCSDVTQTLVTTEEQVVILWLHNNTNILKTKQKHNNREDFGTLAERRKHSSHFHSKCENVV